MSRCSQCREPAVVTVTDPAKKKRRLCRAHWSRALSADPSALRRVRKVR